MPPDPDEQGASIHPISDNECAMPVVDELRRLTDQLRAEFPDAERISFDFEHDLHLHIDVRTLEQAHVIMARLPSLCGGCFKNPFIGDSPHHLFFQRVSAAVHA